METVKPQISILLAVYEPRMDWLREQLESLNAQTYPNIKLYIRDDCSPTVPYEEIQSCVKDCIHAFPYEIKRNEKNLGSNGTFELLTREADGEYFAYCDQDDIWLPEKLEKLLSCLLKNKAELVCSDVFVINATGDRVADSITEVRHRHIFREGVNLAPTLIYRNFVIGCTMLIPSINAKAALPFAEHMVHDHFLAFYCALKGNIAVSREPLILYRIHGNNQTSVLSQITDKQSYIKKHIQPFCERAKELTERFYFPELEIAMQWGEARQKNAARQAGAISKLWKLRRVNPTTTLFELAALRFPSPLFRIALRVIQSGKL